MTIISKSTIDTRAVSVVLFGIGGTPLLLGIIGMNLAVLFSGIGIVSIGLLFLFFGKSTYKASYDEKSKHLLLNSRQDSITINNSNVISVKKRFTLFQIWWPFPRPYYYVLNTTNSAGIAKRYNFVIWSNQLNLKANYDRLQRSIETWRRLNQSAK